MSVPSSVICTEFWTFRIIGLVDLIILNPTPVWCGSSQCWVHESQSSSSSTSCTVIKDGDAASVVDAAKRSSRSSFSEWSACCWISGFCCWTVDFDDNWAALCSSWSSILMCANSNLSSNSGRLLSLAAFPRARAVSWVELTPWMTWIGMVYSWQSADGKATLRRGDSTYRWRSCSHIKALEGLDRVYNFACSRTYRVSDLCLWCLISYAASELILIEPLHFKDSGYAFSQAIA